MDAKRFWKMAELAEEAFAIIDSKQCIHIEPKIEFFNA